MKRSQRIHTILLLLCLLGPIFSMKTIGQSSAVELSLFEITGTIEDNYANITYTWEFDNTQGKSDNELDLQFHVSDKLLLSNISIKIGDDQYYGMIKPLQAAQEEYSEAVESNKSAILVERFGETNRVHFNIKSGVMAQIGLVFEGYITRELGIYQFDLISGVNIERLLPEVTNINLRTYSSSSTVVQLAIAELGSPNSDSISGGRQLDLSLDDYNFEISQ